MQSIIKNKDLIKNISTERIRDEFIKIINSNSPATGVDMLRRFGLLEYIIPELLEGVGCLQGGAHKFDVYEHLLHALQHAADKKYPFHIRLSALFHDIGKPKSRRESLDKNKKQYTFYGHEVIGAKMAKKIMERMKFSSSEIDIVYKMVRYHMFFSDTEVITLSPVRRMIQNVGSDHIWELMQIRECDRVGMAKTEAPYRLRKYYAMIEQALRDPISVKQLKINGNDIMNAGVNPGPRMGAILLALLEEVIEDPLKNDEHYLLSRTLELDKLSDEELVQLGSIAKDKKDELEEKQISDLHKKYNVKK
jgi:poly(A) polymerase/tRNA nucleotidyltransferase (CCA-adding enzyme)